MLDPDKRCFGLQVDDTLWFCTLVDLPCVIEAMKTLDYVNFYKCLDAAQMLYVHNFCIKDAS